MIRVCAAALLLVGVASPCCAQDVESYLCLVREYTAGRGDQATQRLALWSEGDVAAVASVAAVTASARDLQAAAMLHTDLANVIIDTQPETAAFHLSKAREALGVASARIGQRERIEPFVRRWFRYVASIYTSAELVKAASDHIRLGLDRFPDDAGLTVAQGILVEVVIRKTQVPDWRRDTVFNVKNRSRVENGLKIAAGHYLRALAIDGHNAEAHLHLGWVRFFLVDGRAKAELDAAVADAADDTIRYLAHMLLGGLAERANHLADALREYELARTA